MTVDPGVNGAIRVTGWDRDSVAVTIKVQHQDGTTGTYTVTLGQLPS